VVYGIYYFCPASPAGSDIVSDASMALISSQEVVVRRYWDQISAVAIDVLGSRTDIRDQ
jgi:hypothetical protein